VGLLPIAVAGVNIEQLMEGAAAARSQFQAPFADNPCYQYVAARNALHRKGRDIEMFIYYEPRFFHLAEWWKQLYGESEGKDGKGIFPSSAGFTTDLHSLGQYIQDGKRHLFETLLELEEPGSSIQIGSDAENLDGLNYLTGKSLNYVNKKAAQGTLEAHVDGGVPNLYLRIPEASPFYLGNLFYFFEKACAISGYLLGVNPFHQPGVEAYKKNMFRLLGKK
jgi:glucose-6-phosphate isomerase